METFQGSNTCVFIGSFVKGKCTVVTVDLSLSDVFG
jgi:hypothetical protein